MARQRGPLKVQGTLGDLSFYKTQDGYLIREKGGVDGKRIKKDAAFQRTRENGKEFGHAGRAGKLLRMAVRPLILQADNRVVSRLQQQLIKVLQADMTNVRGMRTVVAGDLNLLADFEFNGRSPLSATFYAPYAVAVDRATGMVTVDVPSYVADEMVTAPSGTTHYKLVSSATAIDFATRSFSTVSTASAVLPMSAVPTQPLVHTHAVEPNSAKPLFVVLSLVFYQEVNGEFYLLHNGAYTSVALVRVDVV